MTSSELLPKSEDVRLSCAFIPDAEKRGEVLVLFAFLEILRDIPERTTDPLMGEIRLRWWYEAIEEIEQGRAVRYHPLTEALKAMIATHDLSPKDFLDLIEGQMPLLDKGALRIKDALGVVDRGEAPLFRMAANILGEAADLTDIARLHGMTRIKATRGLSDAGEVEFAHLKREAQKAAKNLSASLMPLALPSSLADIYWHGRVPGPLTKRFRLFWSFVTGRI
ncbi:squalene/phytoene synthase family protein [Asticcacaulis sp.]|uniref:squalene/phytoene synthase family protein n=1 Tax=Asticcacaulis sp. TaxID=1872648 RepID=UPI002CBDFB8C|nr:squalene/phytoene synthase family protein [Asticcacaulis sp.]HTM83183.1 squalene/phytoene synthase family protein [Asticcacaulis sp.]